MIEKRLTQKLAAFKQAMAEGGHPAAAAGAEPGAWFKAEEEASRDPFAYLRQGRDRQLHFLQGSRVNVILAARVKGEVNALVAELREAGYLPENPDYSQNSFLRSLGMVALSLPPLPSLVQGLERFRQAALVGDGDAVLKLSPQPLLDAQAFHLGAFEAAALTMGISQERLRSCLVDLPIPVKVAVVDTGLDAEHPDLRGRILAARDFSAAQLGPVDPAGHGTHVAGIIAGQSAGPPVYGGLAPAARLLDVQVMEPQGFTTVFQMLLGIEWAVAAGANILNLSLGHAPCGEEPDLLEWRAIAAAGQLGVLACAAAGNEALVADGPLISTPADCPAAICVGAVTPAFRRAPFSNFGPAAREDLSGLKPDLAAPGVGIVSTRSRTSHLAPWQGNPLYAAMDGTSMATPFIAGLLALAMGWARSRQIPVEPSVLKEKLLACCVHPLGRPDYELGRGVPNIPRLLDSLEELAARPAAVAVAGPLARPAVVAAPSPSPLPDWRGREREIMAYWKNRIEARLAAGHEALAALAFRPPVSVAWSETHSQHRLRDLRLLHQLGDDPFNRLPWLSRAEGAITRKGRVEGRVVCQFVADLKALCSGHFQPVPWTELRERAARERREHQQLHRPAVPLFLAFAGCFAEAEATAGPEDAAFVAVSWRDQGWIYHGPQALDAWWALFSPQTDAECAGQIERHLDENLVGACLAETVASALALPLPLVLALGRGLKRHTLEQRNNCFAFFNK